MIEKRKLDSSKFLYCKEKWWNFDNSNQQWLLSRYIVDVNYQNSMISLDDKIIYLNLFFSYHFKPTKKKNNEKLGTPCCSTRYYKRWFFFTKSYLRMESILRNWSVISCLPNFGWSEDLALSPFESAEDVLLTADGVGLGFRFLNYVKKN